MGKTIKLGIDFGTSYCFCGTQRGNDVVPLIASTERYGVPSIFYYDRGQKLTGRQAERAAGRRPEYAVRSVKRKLEEAAFTLGGEKQKFTPAQVVEEIIAGIVRDAETQLEQSYLEEYDELEAVITVPIDFSEPRKQLIRAAAGRVRLKNGKNLRVTGVLPEPIAAAIHYFGVTREKDANIVVFDLGGGTLDVALVRANAGNAGVPYEVVDQEGNPKLGGDDWDAKLAEYLEGICIRELGGKLTVNDKGKLLQEARNIKEDLTTLTKFKGDIELRGDFIPVEISRQQFEQMTASLLGRASELVRKLAARIKGHKIDHIILTGGSSNMPQVKAELERLRKNRTFSGTPDILVVEPEHAIAYGAARYAQTLTWTQIGSKAVKEMITLRATHSYGICYTDRSNKDYVTFLIKKNDPLPASEVTTSFTRYENQKESFFAVYESDYTGTEKDVYDSKLWGKRIMAITLKRTESNIPVGRKSKETLTLTKEGVLTCKAVDLVSGVEMEDHVTIERTIS